jgi:APA family basic amino acid/polyamine antiporter
VICTLLYLIVSSVLSGILPVVEYKTNVQYLNAPVGFALALIGQNWAAGLVSAGAVAGITSVLLVMLMSQPRIFFAMSRDRLLPPAVSKVHPRFKTPYITTIITGLIVALCAALFPIQLLGEMTSIGTLFAFVVVSAAVIVLRIKRPEARRPFRVPFGYLIPVLGVLSCLYLMLSLPAATWVRFLGWLDIGILIYWFYGRTHSPLADQNELAARPARSRVGNFVTMAGAVVALNGFFMTLLGFMTELGITTEELAKWHEIRVTPHQADTLGLLIVAAGIVLLVIGRVMARGAEPAEQTAAR